MNKEEIYDAEISPLMTKIIAICKANKIAMLASFSIPNDPNDSADLVCTSALLEDDFDPPDKFLDAMASLYRNSATPLMLTTRDSAGNVKKMEAII